MAAWHVHVSGGEKDGQLMGPGCYVWQVCRAQHVTAAMKVSGKAETGLPFHPRDGVSGLPHWKPVIEPSCGGPGNTTRDVEEVFSLKNNDDLLFTIGFLNRYICRVLCWRGRGYNKYMCSNFCNQNYSRYTWRRDHRDYLSSEQKSIILFLRTCSLRNNNEWRWKVDGFENCLNMWQLSAWLKCPLLQVSVMTTRTAAWPSPPRAGRAACRRTRTGTPSPPRSLRQVSAAECCPHNVCHVHVRL